MKKSLIVLAFFILAAVTAFAVWRVLQPAPEPLAPPDAGIIPTEYRCNEGKTMTVTYLPSGMKVALSDGRIVTLASLGVGGKYADETGTTVFRTSNQYSAFLEERGETTYRGCIVHPLPFSNTIGE